MADQNTIKGCLCGSLRRRSSSRARSGSARSSGPRIRPISRASYETSPRARPRRLRARGTRQIADAEAALQRPVTPAGSRLARRSRSARTAPASSTSAPRGFSVNSDPVLARGELVLGRAHQGADVVAGQIRRSTSRRRPSAITVGTPKRAAARAASSFERMPPVGAPSPRRRRARARAAITSFDLGDPRGAAGARIAVAQPVDVGAAGSRGRRRRCSPPARRAGRCRRSTQLLGRDRVVLVDERHRRRRRAAAPACGARSGSARGPRSREWSSEDLADQELLARERALEAAAQVDLADRRRGLLARNRRLGRLASPSRRVPRPTAPDDTTTTSRPARISAATWRATAAKRPACTPPVCGAQRATCRASPRPAARGRDRPRFTSCPPRRTERLQHRVEAFAGRGRDPVDRRARGAAAARPSNARSAGSGTRSGLGDAHQLVSLGEVLRVRRRARAQRSRSRVRGCARRRRRRGTGSGSSRCTSHRACAPRGAGSGGRGPAPLCAPGIRPGMSAITRSARRCARPCPGAAAGSVNG